MHYLANTTDEVAEQAGNERIMRIHKRVCKVKASEEIGVKYMQAWEERYYDKQEAQAEGRAEGRAEGIAEGRAEGARNKLKELVEKKIKKGKSIEEIADALEETVEAIQELIAEISETEE